MGYAICMDYSEFINNLYRIIDNRIHLNITFPQ